MSWRNPSDPVQGRAFFERSTLFVCALLGPHETRETWLALDAGTSTSPEALAEAVDLARGAASRGYAIVAERVWASGGPWPAAEPPHTTSYLAERDGFVAFAPSVDIWVHMPPRQANLMLRLLAAAPADGEATVRAALAASRTCGMVARVRSVVHGGSGAEIDAVVRGPGDRLEASWFTGKR